MQSNRASVMEFPPLLWSPGFFRSNSLANTKKKPPDIFPLGDKSQNPSKVHEILLDPRYAQLFNENGNRLTHIKTLTFKQFNPSYKDLLMAYFSKNNHNFKNFNEKLLNLKTSLLEAENKHGCLHSITHKLMDSLQDIFSQSELKNKKLIANLLNGLMEFSQQFFKKIRTNAIDFSLLNSKDHYRALTNYWMYLLFRYCSDEEFDLPEDVYAYSLLYPYTDNFIDDINVNPNDKKGFINAIKQSFDSSVGEIESEGNPTLKRTLELIDVIKGQHHHDNPGQCGVMNSLLSIHHAQINSLKQQGLNSKKKCSYENIFNLTLEKGAAAVIPNIYLFKHKLKTDQLQFAILMGELGQLLNDIEGINEDTENNILTAPRLMFIQKNNLDNLVSSIFLLIKRVKTQFITGHSLNKSKTNLVLNSYKIRLLSVLIEKYFAGEPSISTRFLKKLQARLPLPVETIRLIYQVESVFFKQGCGEWSAETLRQIVNLTSSALDKNK